MMKKLLQSLSSNQIKLSHCHLSHFRFEIVEKIAHKLHSPWQREPIRLSSGKKSSFFAGRGINTQPKV
jgi:hypothetical protein